MVNDSDGTPFPYATITLVRADSVAVAGADIGRRWAFRDRECPRGRTPCRWRSSVARPFSARSSFLRERPSASSGSGEAASQIAEVTVVGRRPFVEQQADRYVVNVSNHIVTAGRNAMDVLANTPGVPVCDGAVSVMAKDVTIYIDGRPSRVSGEQLNALLSSIQGDNIARIEVFTNSSSRYDAAGLAIADAEEHLRHINTQDIEVWSAKADFSTPVWKNAKMDIGLENSA